MCHTDRILHTRWFCAQPAAPCASRIRWNAEDSPDRRGQDDTGVITEVINRWFSKQQIREYVTSEAVQHSAKPGGKGALTRHLHGSCEANSKWGDGFCKWAETPRPSKRLVVRVLQQNKSKKSACKAKKCVPCEGWMRTDSAQRCVCSQPAGPRKLHKFVTWLRVFLLYLLLFPATGSNNFSLEINIFFTV